MINPIANDNGDLPAATCLEDLVVAGLRFRCYRLPNGNLIVDKRDVDAFFSMKELTAELVSEFKAAVQWHLDSGGSE